MTDTLLFLTGLILLGGLDFLLVAARTGYTQTNHARLLGIREQEDAQVTKAVLVLHAINRLRASLNLVLVLVRFSMAGLVLYYLSVQMRGASFWVSLGVLLLAALLLFWFEWAVERAVAANPEYWALRLATFSRALMTLSGVLVLPLLLSREAQTAPEPTSAVTEDEVKTLVDAAQEEGVFERGERRMIFSIFQLGQTLAREIMVPRIDMLSLDVRTELVDAVDALLRSGHSRVPVYEETVDNTLGLLYAKDLLLVWREGNQIQSLRSLLRPAYFVPEAKKVDELLAEMQNQRIHIAIVVDEYGGVAGLVTLEDIVEEIVGEIQDEYDQAEESPYQMLKTGEYIFQGRVDLDDFNELMNSSLPVDEADTIGGFIYSRIGRVPEVGETVQEDNLLLTVEQVSGRRIRKVRAQQFIPPQEDGGQADEAER